MKKLLCLCFTFIVAANVVAQIPNDTIAIKQLLEKESSTWREGDVDGHAACWHLQPYSKVLVSTTNGKFYDVPVNNLIHPSKDMMGKGGTAINSNYLFSVHGNNAWVSHDEKSITKEGGISYSHEIRILEKIDGKWKIVAQSIHMYIP
jgi:hypothetical protein